MTPALSHPALLAARAGVQRGLIEFRHLMTNRTDFTSTVGWGGLLPLGVLLLFWAQGETFEVAGTTMSYVVFATPGMLATVVTFAAMDPAFYLTAERADGTLLRARALPHGLVGYAVGRVLTVMLASSVGLVVVLVPGLLLFDGLGAAGLGGWATLLWVTLLGLAAVVPVGMVIGTVLRSTKGVFGFGTVIIVALTATSGIWAPVQTWPGWVQGLAQALPVYWLGHGLRAALLPDVAAAAELAGGWRLWATAAVLAAWALAGLVVVPLLLRRAARRQSASLVAQRQHEVLQQAV